MKRSLFVFAVLPILVACAPPSGGWTAEPAERGIFPAGPPSLEGRPAGSGGGAPSWGGLRFSIAPRWGVLVALALLGAWVVGRWAATVALWAKVAAAGGFLLALLWGWVSAHLLFGWHPFGGATLNTLWWGVAAAWVLLGIPILDKTLFLTKRRELRLLSFAVGWGVLILTS